MPKSVVNYTIMLHLGKEALDTKGNKSKVKEPVTLKEGLEIPEKALPWIKGHKPEWIEGTPQQKKNAERKKKSIKK